MMKRTKKVTQKIINKGENDDWIRSARKVKTPKPKVELIGSDSNVFLLLGKCAKALRRAGQVENEKELSQKVLQASSFDDALCIMMDYCEIY